MSKSKLNSDKKGVKSKTRLTKNKNTNSRKPLPLDNLKEEVKNEKDKFLRLFAEFENYKKRTSRERLDLFKTASQEIMTAIIPVLDDFDRAKNQINIDKSTEEVKGLILIYNKLIEIMKSNGLSEIEVSKGDTFDPEIHEAISQIPSKNSNQKGKIIDIVEKGYQLGEKTIRFPKVVVGQ
ncbi:MAG: nucleotide exchange factor GrpE [Flavobacteriaceae bacterium]|nr:nucleotide exchange factor GrpE [Flavobacteriaceae bacterium]|tara:strand:- start:2639 stop:3178 length:540 start_codon:yes stop_codon:yes gene_type:complete